MCCYDYIGLKCSCIAIVIPTVSVLNGFFIAYKNSRKRIFHNCILAEQWRNVSLIIISEKEKAFSKDMYQAVHLNAIIYSWKRITTKYSHLNMSNTFGAKLLCCFFNFVTIVA